ncbi:hypothetical protein BDW74DRAFT_180824 [Aspergillus multicolor]|uniref:mRNA export factor mexA n=1 Tax=Aspergillus multicolor TaxID=41759 RepID=UPI003CCD4C1B
MMKRGRGSRGRASTRSSTSDRGGIRKRSTAPPTKIDRDGDLAMGAGAGAIRGQKTRGGPGRPTPSGRAHALDRSINQIQKALSTSGAQANIRQGGRGGPSEQVAVRGWKQSKAASNRDGGVESLITFLEKKLTSPDSKSGPRVKINKSRVEGDALIVSIRPDSLERMLQLNGFSFAGAPLTVEKFDQASAPLLNSVPTQNGTTPSTADTKAKMTAILGKRYYQDSKLLDLSKLGTDPDLVAMGIFGTTSTESKFFPALMKVWELNFDNTTARREAVESVSLADNQLANITVVTTLSQTFPDLKNLDLSNNNFADAQALIGWRWKFRKLQFLDLTGNPFSSDPTFKDTMLKWYPELKVLNNTQVRTDEEIAAQKKTPIPVRAPHFHDEGQIAENFIRAFFTGYDGNRADILNGFYDTNSTFSLNVNTSAPRALQTEPAPWDPYLKKSRNLLKISHLPARMSRTYAGVEKIRELWTTLPPTRHPDIVAQPGEWLIECFPIPGLPDMTGQSSSGVGGFLIMVHGKFEEDNSGKVETRSFDRTFILGPGNGVGGIRVISDVLCLRAYGGNEAWQLEPQPAAAPPAMVPTSATAANPAAPAGYGLPAPGKPDAQVQQEQLVMQLSAKTMMTLQYSELALSGNGWNMEAALKNFEELKTQGQLPPEAFLPGATA